MQTVVSISSVGAKAEATRRRILDGAFDVMLCKGLAGATTKEIAAAAHLTDAALYKYFINKTDLLVAVLLDRIPAPSALIPAADPARPLEPVIEATVYATIRFLEQIGPILLAFDSDPDLRQTVGDALAESGIGVRAFHKALQDTLAAHPESAHLAAATTDTIAYIIFGACNQYALLARTEPDTKAPTPKAFAHRIAASVMLIIQHG